MDQSEEETPIPVVYGPPRPPHMIEAERQERIRAEEQEILLQENAMIASGQYCRCSYDRYGNLAPVSDSEDEPCPFHPWNHPVAIRQAQAQGGRSPYHADPANQVDDEDEGTDHETATSRPNEVIGHLRDAAEPRDLQASLAEGDDSDDEYVPANEGQEEDEDGDGEEEEEDDDDEDDEDEEYHPVDSLVDLAAIGGFGGGITGGITRQQLIALLQTQDLSTVFDFVDSDDSDIENVRSHRRRPRYRPPPPVVKPTIEGMKLQRSGVFGANEMSRRSKKHLMRRMLDREHGLGSLADRRRNEGLLIQDMIPEMRADQIIHYDEPVYSGQFSDDGNFYYSVCQDFKVRMYDTSNPYNWKHYKTVSYPWGQWTLTDASLSPDNKWLVYASHSALVSIAPTDPLDRGDPYTLNLEGGLQGHDLEIARRMNFSIFSIRFSGDGRELVAGTRQNTIVLFDIEKRSIQHTIMGHENDVNAVCFGDKDEPHLIYSGSDDGVLKVWDRRSLSDKREAGAFVGHKGGLTYIDSKNDGRYILSNGKDQTAKLWDVRMAYSSQQFHAEDMTQFTRYSEYDYRYMDDEDVDYAPHPKDNSLVTFRGHKVQRTLIRCHFAPPDSANSRYVYSGSSDGKVHIWNMDSTVAKVIDVGKATKDTRRNDGRRRYFTYDDRGGEWEACVRDVSWHPHAPIMAASAWNSYNMARGTTSVHSFTDAHGDEDDLPMGRSYNAMMERQEDLCDIQYD